ncbi:MAG: ImmA/IrrE family metallo-endopeptidase [Clostridiales bacterium]|nr:ImmA/IrrE family metallo-endopeptidase [Clostridiales bacterium]
MAVRKNNIDEVLKQAENGIRAVFENEAYKEYLSVMGRFHNYSIRNIMLIKTERPEATYVAGYKAWNKNFGRHVKKGEKGIPIIAYIPNVKYVEEMKKDESGIEQPALLKKVIPRFAVKYVYDISQTEGKPLPKLMENLQGKVDDFNVLFQSIKDISPYEIGFEKITTGANGYCNVKNKAIKIKEGLSEKQNIKTAIHEVAHAHMHSDKDEKLDKNTMEVEAEAVAFATCEHFGIDTSAYSFPYIASWSSGKELKELEESLDRIQHKSSYLIATIEKRYLELNPPEAEINRSVNTKLVEKLLPEQVLDAEHIKTCLDFKIPVGYYAVQEKATGKQIETIDDLMSIANEDFNNNYESVFKDIKLPSQIKDAVGADGFCYTQGGVITPSINPYVMSAQEAVTSKFLISEFMKSDQWGTINESLKYNAPVHYGDLISTRDKYFDEKYFSQRTAAYPDKTEAEIRNLAGYLTITEDSMNISLKGRDGIWDAIESQKINGNEYFLMYNKNDEKQNVIVDKSGNVLMHKNCDFEDLKDRLSEEASMKQSQEKPSKEVKKSRKKNKEKER